MRNIISPEVESCRINHPTNGIGDSHNGCFVFPKRGLAVIISAGEGWEHVSVSRRDRTTPSWEEMCWAKETFFRDDEWVLQYHPAEEDYVDYGRNVLHLWKPLNQEIPKPPKIMV